MARKPRLDRVGCLHHVMGRGNARAAIFIDDVDRKEFLRLLADGVDRFGHSIHAYCLMGNHFHLAVRTGDVPLSKIMQNLLFRFTRHVNRRYGRIGHLFQGRFKSILVDEQSYLLELVRYIHLNPVRAGLVERPDQWIWSGHRAYLGRSKDGFLDTAWVLGVLGGRLPTARRRYEAFVKEGLEEGWRKEFHRGGEQPGVLGEAEFLQRLHFQRKKAVYTAPSLECVIARVCLAENTSEEALRRVGQERGRAQARALVALLAQDEKVATMTEVAGRFGRDVTTLSRSVTNLRKRLRKEAALAQKVRTLKKVLSHERHKDAIAQA